MLFFCEREGCCFWSFSLLQKQSTKTHNQLCEWVCLGCKKYHSNNLYLWVKPETEFLSQWKLICLMQLDHYQSPFVEPKLWRYSLKVVKVKSWNSSIVWSRNAQDPTNLEFVINLSVFCRSVSKFFWLFELSQKFDQHLWSSFSDYLLEYRLFFCCGNVLACKFQNNSKHNVFLTTCQFFLQTCPAKQKEWHVDKTKRFFVLFLACLCSFSQQNVRENNSVSFFWKFVKQ